MKTQVLNLIAGVPVEQIGSANFFFIVDATYPIDISFFQNGALIEPAEGVDTGFYSRPAGGFSSFIIESAVSQTVKIATSNGSGGYNKSLVSTLDGSRAQTLANESFLGAAGLAASPGLYGNLQIFNPIGSGEKTEVKAIEVSLVTAGSVNIKPYSTELTTLQGNGVSKYAGGADSKAEVRNELTGAFLASGGAWLSYSLAAGAVKTINFREPIILEEGRGILIGCFVANTQINANFEFSEFV